MKKLFLSVFILAVSWGMMFSQNIKVTSPHAGSNWKQGAAYTIIWQKSGVMSGQVKLRIYNPSGTVKFVNISNSTPNNGKFGWTVPPYASPGKYIVRVKTIDNKVFGNSQVFTISSSKAGVSTIKVTKPGPGTTWNKGVSHHISWSKNGPQNGFVKIRIYNAAGNLKIKDLTNNTPNNGNYHTPPTILDSISPGNYIVRVKTLDNKVYGNSNVITIKASPGLKAQGEFNRPNSGFQNPAVKNNPNITHAGQKIKFYSPKAGYTWKPMKDCEVTFEVFKKTWPYSSFYFNVKLVPATPISYFKDIFLKKNLNYNNKDTGHSFIYSFMWKFLGSYNVPTGKYRVVVQSITRPELKGESEIIAVDNKMGYNTGFIGESEVDLEIEDVYYDYYKKSIAARIRNKGFSTYSGDLSIGYDFTFSKISTFNDPKCSTHSDSGLKKYKTVSIGKQLTKVFYFYNYNCFDKRPADFLPKKGPMQYTVRVFHKGNKTAIKAGLICKTKKPDIIATSPIFIYTKQNTVTRVGPNLKGTLNPGLFNWISKTQFKTRVSVNVMNWGCSAKTFDINLHMDGPYLNGKKGIKLGTVTLNQGQEKNFVSQPIVFSIPKSSKYQRFLLVAYQGESGDQGYPNSYMNNFLLANIRIFAESNTVRGDGW